MGQQSTFWEDTAEKVVAGQISSLISQPSLQGEERLQLAPANDVVVMNQRIEAVLALFPFCAAAGSVGDLCCVGCLSADLQSSSDNIVVVVGRAANV